jgi:hypothetical protein
MSKERDAIGWLGKVSKSGIASNQGCTYTEGTNICIPYIVRCIICTSNKHICEISMRMRECHGAMSLNGRTRDNHAPV